MVVHPKNHCCPRYTLWFGKCNAEVIVFKKFQEVTLVQRMVFICSSITQLVEREDMHVFDTRELGRRGNLVLRVVIR